MQETTLFLQLLYKNEFKNEFLNLLKGKYEKMIILAVDDQAYMKNYKYLDTNLDRGMHFHFLVPCWAHRNQFLGYAKVICGYHYFLLFLMTSFVALRASTI